MLMSPSKWPSRQRPQSLGVKWTPVFGPLVKQVGLHLAGLAPLFHVLDGSFRALQRAGMSRSTVCGVLTSQRLRTTRLIVRFRYRQAPFEDRQ